MGSRPWIHRSRARRYVLDSGERVDCIKRACLGKLPQTLILCLKRITFDYAEMAKVR